MKKLIFTMDDFGIHESISYLLRDMLRAKIQKMVDAWSEAEIGTLKMKLIEINVLLDEANRQTNNYKKLYDGLMAQNALADAEALQEQIALQDAMDSKS